MTTRRRAILVLIAAVVVTSAAASQYWVLRGRVTTVESNRLYRSAALEPQRLLDLCRVHHITTVIDLRTDSPETRAEADVLARAGVVHIPLPTGQVPRPETVARFLELMDARRHEAVLVHCTHGVGRSGVFSAIYRMEYQGWSNWRAVTEAMLLAGFGSFGPRNSKTAFLWSYVPRGKASTR